MELKHFCLQYDEWKEALNQIQNFSRGEKIPNFSNVEFSDPTGNAATKAVFYESRIKMVEKCAYDADPTISRYILLSVTKEYSYVYLKNVLNIPCGKNYFYDKYRRFFFLLDKVRDNF